MSFTGLLDKTMNVQSVATTADAFGGQTYTPTTTLTGVPCRVRAMSLQEQDILMRAGLATTHRIYCDAPMVIDVSYQLVVDGITYRIVQAKNPDFSDQHYEIDVVRFS